MTIGEAFGQACKELGNFSQAKLDQLLLEANALFGDIGNSELAPNKERGFIDMLKNMMVAMQKDPEFRKFISKKATQFTTKN